MLVLLEPAPASWPSHRAGRLELTPLGHLLRLGDEALLLTTQSARADAELAARRGRLILVAEAPGQRLRRSFAAEVVGNVAVAA
jgi:hypothetical protein